jgi:hypothetical protein
VRSGDTIVNYGRSVEPTYELPPRVTWINHPKYIMNAADTLKCITVLDRNDVPVLEWTTRKEQVSVWLSEGHNVYARTTLTGKKGHGIKYLDPAKGIGDHIVDAPLYTKEYPKTHEFRVHVFRDKAIDMVQKRKMGPEKLEKHGLNQAEERIRNKRFGWVFSKRVDYIPEGMEAACVAAVRLCGLDYGGVDVLADQQAGTFRICEVNTAPGMFKSHTFNAYIEALHSVGGEA